LTPAYRHARHYVGRTAGDVQARITIRLQGADSPLIRAAVAAGVNVQPVATMPGSRMLERRLKRWHNDHPVLPSLPQRRGGRAR
jgi:hypothetical protein